MGTLTRESIVEYLTRNELIRNARKDPYGNFEVEAASYDLSIGIAVKKKHGDKPFQKRHEIFTKEVDPNTKWKPQKTITLSPGQMVFVISDEEILMPEHLCGTVYSRNSLALKGILALNAGHIDPGYHGPITIKLINLRSVDATFFMGQPIFTIVFNTMEPRPYNPLNSHKRIATKEEMLERVITATDEALDNALYDLALLREFVKEKEFGKALKNWLIRTFWGLVTLVIASTIALLGAIETVTKFIDLMKDKHIIK
jgi:deoxycytidine triphosphate deaminase